MGTLLYRSLFYFLETLNHKLMVLARQPGQQASRIYLSPPSDTEVMVTYRRAWLFMCVLGISAQVLMFTQQVLLPTEPLSSP